MSRHAVRLLAGAVLLVVVGWLLPFLAARAGLGDVLTTPEIGALGWAVAAFLGGFVARTGFLPVAFVMWVAVWKLSLLALYQIAAPTGEASVVGLLQLNALAIAMSLAATFAGTLLGQKAAACWARHGGGPVAA